MTAHAAHLLWRSYAIATTYIGFSRTCRYTLGLFRLFAHIAFAVAIWKTDMDVASAKRYGHLHVPSGPELEADQYLDSGCAFMPFFSVWNGFAGDSSYFYAVWILARALDNFHFSAGPVRNRWVDEIERAIIGHGDLHGVNLRELLMTAIEVCVLSLFKKTMFLRPPELHDSRHGDSCVLAKDYCAKTGSRRCGHSRREWIHIAGTCQSHGFKCYEYRYTCFAGD